MFDFLDCSLIEEKESDDIKGILFGLMDLFLREEKWITEYIKNKLHNSYYSKRNCYLLIVKILIHESKLNNCNNLGFFMQLFIFIDVIISK